MKDVLYPLLDKAKIPHPTIYDLRETHGTISLEWVTKERSSTVDVNLETLEMYYHDLNFMTGEMSDHTCVGWQSMINHLSGESVENE